MHDMEQRRHGRVELANRPPTVHAHGPAELDIVHLVKPRGILRVVDKEAMEAPAHPAHRKVAAFAHAKVLTLRHPHGRWSTVFVHERAQGLALEAEKAQLVPGKIIPANVVGRVGLVAHDREIIMRCGEAHPVRIPGLVRCTGTLAMRHVAPAPVLRVQRLIVAGVGVEVKLPELAHHLRGRLVERRGAPAPPPRVFADPIPLGRVALALEIFKGPVADRNHIRRRIGFELHVIARPEVVDVKGPPRHQ